MPGLVMIGLVVWAVGEYIYIEVGRRHGGGPQDGSKPQLGVHHP